MTQKYNFGIFSFSYWWILIFPDPRSAQKILRMRAARAIRILPRTLRALAQKSRNFSGCARSRSARAKFARASGTRAWSWVCIFPEITSFKNAMKIPKTCHRKIEKSSRLHEKDFTERSLTAHTGSSGMNSFYFQMSEDLEILQKQNGNKETLRFLFYLCKLLFSKNCQLYISLFSVEISITWCFNCGISFASELDEYVLKALLQDLSIFKHSYIHFSDF